MSDSALTYSTVHGWRALPCPSLPCSGADNATRNRSAKTVAREWLCEVTMSVLLVLVMCLAVQATSCPSDCSCREVVTCYGLVQDLPISTSSLVIRPPATAADSSPPDISMLLTRLTELPHLLDLSLVNCAIRDLSNITFDGLERLKTLDLSCNLITELSEETSFNQTDLRALDVSHNLIRVIHGAPFRTLCSLEVLNLSGNAIDRIPVNSFCGLHALITLDLSSNNLTALQDEMFVSLTSLQQLNLSKNQIETLSESCFSSLQRLQQLDLSWNKLTHMAPGTLQALPSLSRLMIAGNLALGGGNKDTALLVGTGRRLQTLDASRTGLEHVPAALTHSVRTLRLAGNSIRTVQCGDVDSYPLLQLLDLTNNLLEEMEEDALGRLEMLVILYLTDNKLHAIPRSLPDELKILHLEFNRIEQIVSGDLLGLPKLEVLLLNDNNIKVVQEGAFSQMTSLITLDLSRNPISILPAGTMSGPTRLQVLRLSSLTVDPPAEDMCFPVPAPEHLVRLDLSHSPGLARQLLADKAALSAFRELQELNLTNADLINLRSDLLYFLPQLRDLHITGNRLNCSGLLWLALWMRVQDQPEHRQVICVSPPELYGTLVVDLQDTDMATTTTAATTEKITTITTSISMQMSSSTLLSTAHVISDINAEVGDLFDNISESGSELSTVRGLQNTTKSLREKKNETVRPTSSSGSLTDISEIAPDARANDSTSTTTTISIVTAMSENRFDIPDAASDRVHLYPTGIESPSSTDAANTPVTDGHIAGINPSDNRLATQASNYQDEAMRTKDASSEQDASEIRNKATSEVSGVTMPATAASRDNERVAEFSLPHYANQPDNSSLNKPRWHDSEISSDLFMGSERPNNNTPVTERAVSERTEADNATSGAATGEMSMYSSSREDGEGAQSSPFMHPGMLVLLAAVLGTGAALSTLISHVRKRRKRMAEYRGCYNRQQDIEVNSLPGISELW